LKNDLPFHRLAVSVSRKIGKAVERNYIKRRMRDLYSHNRDMLKEGHDLWILMKKKFSKSDSDKIEKIFVEALLKINDK